MRRRLLLFFYLPLALLGVYAFFIEPNRLVVRRDSVALDRWDLRPLRVALISDVHAGAPWIDDEKLARIVATTNGEHPDLVLLLGDSVIHRMLGGHFVPPEHTAQMLRGLHARYGVFGVLGNHDGWFSRTRVKAAYDNAGIPTLVNQTAELSIDGRTLSLAGLADLRTDRPDVGIVARARGTVIAMTHTPDIFPRVPPNAAITVAGHTHGGQVWLPLLGRLIVPSRFGQRYAYGHVVEDGHHLYVTSGIGTSMLPIRFCVPPEIRLLELRSANRAARPSPSRSPAATP